MIDVPKRPVVVVLNPASGGGNRTGDVAPLFHEAGLEPIFHVLEVNEDPAGLAHAAGQRSAVVVAAGGDGTVSRVAAGLVGTSAALGVLPLGTLNHFAKDLRIPVDVKQAVATIASGGQTSVDVGSVNDRLFVNGASLGIYPNIVETRDALRRQGYRKWSAFMRATWQVLRRHRGIFVTIRTGAAQESAWRTPFLFVGNNEYEIDGIQLGGRKTLESGRLFAYLAPRLRTRYLPVLFARALVGRVKASRAFEIVSALEMSIDLPRRTRIKLAIDGELAILATPLRFRANHAALPVITPPSED